MKLLKQDITLSLCFSLCSSHSPTRIKVASTRLMLRNVNVLLLHAVTCVNSSKVTYPLFDAGVVGNVGLDCENRGSSLLQTRLMLRISLFFSVSLSLSLSLFLLQYIRTHTFSRSHSSNPTSHGISQQESSSGSLIFLGAVPHRRNRYEKPNSQTAKIKLPDSWQSRRTSALAINSELRILACGCYLGHSYNLLGRPSYSVCVQWIHLRI